jgi:putative acetyltransferase
VWVRRERPEDVPAVQALVTAAFGGPEVADLLAALRGDHCWLGLSFVAEMAAPAGVADGAESSVRPVVGHLAYSRAWVDDAERVVDVLVLSPVSVHPTAQRRGVGKALIDESFRALADRPEPLVFLEGDPTYYSRRGFVPARPLGFTAPSVRIPGRAFQVRPMPTFVGQARGALVYPDVFWRYDAVGLRGEELGDAERRYGP